MNMFRFLPACMIGNEYGQTEAEAAAEAGKLLFFELDLSSCTGERLTAQVLDDLFAQARGLGARRVYFICNDCGNPSDLDKLVKSASETGIDAEVVSTDMSCGLRGKIFTDRRCFKHLCSCHVTMSGDVYACAGLPVVTGNIRNVKLGDIVRDSEVFEDLRNFRNAVKGPCQSCDVFGSCYGCRGAAHRFSGDYIGSDPDCERNEGKEQLIARLPVDAVKLVPHRPPMLMVERLLEVADRSSVSELIVKEEMIFLGENGFIDDAAYPEILSQAIAAHGGFKNLREGAEPHQGVLLGIKKFSITGSAGIGDRLVISLRKIAKFDEFGIISGEVKKGEEVIASGEIKIWHSAKLS